MNTRALILSLVMLAGGARAPAAEAQAAPAPATRLEGRVIETINAAGYTYLRVESGSGKVWAAAPEMPIKPGDHVVVSGAMPMANFHSKTLNRSFDVMYFSGSVIVNGKTPPASGAASPLPAGHPPTAAKDSPSLDLADIKRAPNGKTVAEIYAAGAALAGKPVKLRGRVVKYNGGILGRNWLHVRDGSGADGTNDLTVTSKGTAKVGDLVLVEGLLAANRDFGAGYKYGLIVEDATIVVE
jgi:hypothetical protein